MKTKNNILSVLSLFIVSLSTNISAEPSGISLETIKILGGERFWQSEVKCVDKDDSRYIEKKVNQEQWCLQLSPTACFSTKEAAANSVCADSYDDAILTSNQLNEAIISPPTAPASTLTTATPTPTPTQATLVSATAQPSPSSAPAAALTTSTVSAAQAQTEEFIDDDDDDDDTYFNIDELIIEKAQLESELSDVQLKKTELNRRKAELQNSISTY